MIVASAFLVTLFPSGAAAQDSPVHPFPKRSEAIVHRPYDTARSSSVRAHFDDFAIRIHTLAQSLSSSLDLAAATMAALRRARRRAQVLLRIGIEFLFALGATEVIGLPFMLGSSSGGSRFYVHAADRIFHSRRAIHYDLP